jgi:hypothetical protein
MQRFVALMALIVALLANVFLHTLRTVQAVSARLAVADWAKPALGGLALGVFAVPLVLVVGWQVGQPGQGLGLLGGGYGAVQVAISGASWLPGGWSAVALLAGLCIAKLFASSLTIGTGGSAADFAPSLVIGGLLGGAFGRTVQLLSNDPRINPAAFALIAMGTFYGGLAHAPLSSLIIVCELAGSYDLLVPLMLAEGIAFIALRHRSLYQAQLPNRRYSPAHSEDSGLVPPLPPPAGAVPALVGWAAVTGTVGPAAWVLFAIVFVWTPPHFWALAMRYSGDYRAAGIPMLPVVRGPQETRKQILLYSLVLFGTSLLLVPVASMGLVYVVAAVVLGGWFVWRALRLWRGTSPAESMRLFRFSIVYLALLFAAVAADALVG